MDILKFYAQLNPQARKYILASINKTQTTPLQALEDVHDIGLRRMLLRRDPVFCLIRNCIYTLALKKAKGINADFYRTWAEYIINEGAYSDPTHINPVIRDNTRRSILHVVRTTQFTDNVMKGV